MADLGEHEGRHGLEREKRGARRVHITINHETGGHPFALSVPDWLFNAALAGLAALAVLVVGGGVLTARMGMELRRLHEIEDENAELRAENRKIETLARDIDELEILRRKVLALAGAEVGTGGQGSGADVVGIGSGTKQAGAKTAGVSRFADRGAPTGPGSQSGVSATPTPLLPAAGAPSFLPTRWPVDGVVSKGFRMNVTPDREHHGVDIAAPHGTLVRAAGGGVVAFAGMDSVFGHVVIINHGGGLETLYGHNSRLLVGVGDSVRAGQEIARVGSTGESSAPHVHFEVRRGGRPVDPYRYVER